METGMKSAREDAREDRREQGRKGSARGRGGGRERIREEQTRYRKIQRGKSRREVAGRTRDGASNRQERVPGALPRKQLGKGFRERLSGELPMPDEGKKSGSAMQNRP